MLLQPGDELGRYHIVAQLGGGGMGEVYRAHDAKLARDVALKVLRPEEGGAEGSSRSGGDTDGGARMVREARATASLEHPNLIAVYDVGELTLPRGQGEVVFIAMELVRGKPLRAYVGDALMPMGERLRWLIDVAKALGAAHALGIVHRDVKPENVMIRDDGVVKVLDFGVAKKTHAVAGALGTTSTEAQVMPTLTQRGAVVGTPYYMAPEQMRAEALDGRADQFAWGVVAYELLAGRPPWGREAGPLQTVSEILSGEPVAPSLVNAEIPKALEAVILKTLAKKRDDRFATMAGLIAALTDEGVGVAPTEPKIRVSIPSAPETARGGASVTTARAAGAPGRWGRRGWAIAASCGLVVAAGAGAVVARHAAGARGAAAMSAPKVAPKECATSVECAANGGGKAAVCREGACVALENEDCRVLAEKGDVGNDDTVWIGAINWNNSDADPQTAAVELARREIAHAAGLPPRRGSDRRRPFGIVACATMRDQNAAVQHLVDLHVPVVVGFIDHAETIASVFLPRHIAVITSSSDGRVTHMQSSDVTPRLVWRANASASDFGAAAGALVNELALRATKREARVLITRVRSDRMLQESETLLSALRIGGRQVGEASDSVLEIESDRDQVAPAPGDQEKITRFAATLVVNFESDASWLRATDGVGNVRPEHVFAAGAPMDAIEVLVGSDDSARQRFFLIDTPASTAGNVKFTLRFNDAFGPRMTVTESTAPSIAYDPVYVAAFAIAAAGDAPITGDAVATGIARLVGPGPKIDVGPARIFDAFDTLRSGQSIDLEGAGSPLDFDTKTGESAVRLAIYCLKRGRKGLDFVESGASYEPETKTIVGTMRCR